MSQTPIKPHPQAEMLKAAAENADVLFQYFDLNPNQPGWSSPTYTIRDVLNYSHREWRVYKEPEVVHVYFSFANGMIHSMGLEVDLERWDLKLIFTDGKLTGAEVAK